MVFRRRLGIAKRMNVLLTTLPRPGDDDVPFMDIHNFEQVPRVGEYVSFMTDGITVYRVVQVVHVDHKNGYDFAVTVEPSALKHSAILDKDKARDG